MTEPKKKLTQAQMLEQAQAELATTKADLESANSKADEDGDEMESLKADVAAIKESVATLSETVNTLAESVNALKSEEDEEGGEGDGEDEGSEGEGEGSEGDGDSEEDQDEETKAVLTLCSLALSGLMEDNATLKSLEQNIQKRASAKLSSMCAELGISPAMKTGAAPSNSANAGETDLSNLTGLDKATAALKSKSTK